MKIATIGSNIIVDKFISAVHTVDGCEVVACYSRTKERALEFATKHDILNHYTSLSEMLENSDIDFIYIASPNSLHYAQTKQALLAGKHVICEKPFTSTYAETEELVSIAKKNNLFLFEAITTIHLPNYRWILDSLKEIGNVKLVTCNFSKYSSRYTDFLAGDTPNVFNPELSGGALMDLNVYNLHFVIGLFGKPNSMQYFPNLERGIDSSGVAILTYDNFIATCISGKDSDANSSIQIQGVEGSIYIDAQSSRLTDVKLVKNEKTTHSGTHEFDNAMHYELLDFYTIFSKNDYEACYQLLDHSLTVMDVLHGLRA